MVAWQGARSQCTGLPAELLLSLQHFPHLWKVLMRGTSRVWASTAPEWGSRAWVLLSARGLRWVRNC